MLSSDFWMEPRRCELLKARGVGPRQLDEGCLESFKTNTAHRIVCQELKQQQDIKSLFHCALVCKSWASLALPLLYRYEHRKVAQP